MSILAWGIDAIERGWIPDFLTRLAIRRMCRERLNLETNQREKQNQQLFFESMKSGPIAPVPDAANRQHYELPSDFFEIVLGPHRKYSSCYFPEPSSTLQTAEEAALELTCEHAQLVDGQNILELGCGWGSLSLWMAENYLSSSITAVSNSTTQRLLIEKKVKEKGLKNLNVITADMNEFETDRRGYDRVLSVEMFEHMRNYERLLERVSSWLKPDGKLFVHVFCHRNLCYPFESAGTSNWMGQYFFTGGLMPSVDLFLRFAHILSIEDQWNWNGTHYQKTAEEWLKNLDHGREKVLHIFREVYGREQSNRWFQRWRMFFLAVSELFGFAGGNEWFVTHVTMKPV